MRPCRSTGIRTGRSEDMTNARVRYISMDDSVFVCRFASSGPSWLPGTFVGQRGPLSLDVQLEDSQVLKCLTMYECNHAVELGVHMKIRMMTHYTSQPIHLWLTPLMMTLWHLFQMSLSGIRLMSAGPQVSFGDFHLAERGRV